MDQYRPFNNPIYRPNSLVGKLERAGYIAPYDSARGSKVKVVNIKLESGDANWRQKFPDDPELTNATIKGISIINTTEAVNNSYFQAATGDFIANMSTAQLRSMLFVLARGSENLAILPTVSMVKAENSGKYQFFDSTEHIWGDSYILITTGGVVAANEVISFMVYYE